MSEQPSNITAAVGELVKGIRSRFGFITLTIVFFGLALVVLCFKDQPNIPIMWALFLGILLMTGVMFFFSLRNPGVLGPVPGLQIEDIKVVQEPKVPVKTVATDLLEEPEESAADRAP